MGGTPISPPNDWHKGERHILLEILTSEGAVVPPQIQDGGQDPGFVDFPALAGLLIELLELQLHLVLIN